MRSLCKCFIHHLSSSADTAPKAPSGLYIAQSFMPVHTCIGLARTIYIRCTYGIFGREITKYMVIYGVYIRFWPTLHMQHQTPDQLYEISSIAALYITRNWATPFFVTPNSKHGKVHDAPDPGVWGPSAFCAARSQVLLHEALQGSQQVRSPE